MTLSTQVLGPLTIIMLLSGLLRHYVAVLMNAPPKKQPLLVVRETYALTLRPSIPNF